MHSSEKHRIDKERLVLVEGKSDVGFFYCLCHQLGISSLQIMPYEGKDNLKNILGLLTQQAKFETVERLGVIRDADDAACRARDSVINALTNAGLPSPSQSNSSIDCRPETFVLTVPPGQPEGCLETLLLETIPEPIAKCVERYIDCANVPASGSRRAKAKLHTYIAAQDRPGLKIGEAVRRGYWNLDHPAFEPLNDFLHALAE